MAQLLGINLVSSELINFHLFEITLCHTYIQAREQRAFSIKAVFA
jgi:hypothetical protein